MFGQFYRIRIGLDYTMKILDWIRTAIIFDPFNTIEHGPVQNGIRTEINFGRNKT